MIQPGPTTRRATGAGAWHEVGAAGEPAFENSWVNHTVGTWDTAAFRLKNGAIELKGVVKSGTMSAAIFTLPSWARPAVKKQYVRKNTGTVGSIEVGTDGTVKPFSGTSGDVHLTGIVFPI